MTPRAYIHGLRRRIAIAMAVVVAGVCAAVTACDDLIYDDRSDCVTCTPVYTVRFTYTMNMEYADALAHYVDQVTLCAFDSDDLLAYTLSATADELLANDQCIDVTDTPRGTYTLVAWAMGEEVTANSYEQPALIVGSTCLTDLYTRLSRDYDNSTAIIDHDLTPLFHGMVTSADLTAIDYDGEKSVTVDLTKDTNVVRIVLQHLSGEDIDDEDFIFRITDDNGLIAYDNSLTADETLTYYPWSTYSGTASIGSTDDDEDDDALTSVGAAIAEFTVSRLTPDSSTRLTVYNAETGDRVLSIPVVDYALLIKGKYNDALTDQEYLDRQDEYAMTFFLDEDDDWYTATILINNWRVILQDVTL